MTSLTSRVTHPMQLILGGILAAVLVVFGVQALGVGGGGSTPGPPAKRVVAYVDTIPVYEIEIDRMYQDELRRIRTEQSVFANPSPEEQALLRESALHLLLLEALYQRPGFTFSKTRAIALTREAAFEQARAVREALLSGVPEDTVYQQYIKPAYAEPHMRTFDLIEGGTTAGGSMIRPEYVAYPAEAFATAEGGVSRVIEESDGLYVLTVQARTTTPEGKARVQGNQFFIVFDKERGKRLVKEEDLAAAKVRIEEPKLAATRAIRLARASADVSKRLELYRGALDTLNQGGGAKDPELHFLRGWVSEELARANAGPSLAEAEAHFLEAAELRGAKAPGDPDVAYYRFRAGQMQEEQGKRAEALASYTVALEAAKDNIDLTATLIGAFTRLGEQTLLASAQQEYDRMEGALTYQQREAWQIRKQKPGEMAEGTRGMEQVFHVTGESKVHEDSEG